VNAPKEKARGELASKTARKLITQANYATVALLANVFGSVFWFFESHRARVADRIENERSYG
jgi:hypothetical protein